MNPSGINTVGSPFMENNTARSAGVSIFNNAFPFSQTPEPPPASRNRSSSRSNRKPLYLFCLVYCKCFLNVSSAVLEWAFFQRACQVPGCLLCASVCVIRDRDWIRDGSLVTLRWKYHTLPLPSHHSSTLQLNGHVRATAEENDYWLYWLIHLTVDVTDELWAVAYTRQWRLCVTFGNILFFFFSASRYPGLSFPSCCLSCWLSLCLLVCL